MCSDHMKCIIDKLILMTIDFHLDKYIYVGPQSMCEFKWNELMKISEVEMYEFSREGEANNVHYFLLFLSIYSWKDNFGYQSYNI